VIIVIALSSLSATVCKAVFGGREALRVPYPSRFKSFIVTNSASNNDLCKFLAASCRG
jgi:hypothetical protein